jgi:iron complex outermembrane receptor protein
MNKVKRYNCAPREIFVSAGKILLSVFFVAVFQVIAHGQQPDSIYQLSLKELLSMKIELGSRVEQRTKFEAMAPVDVYSSEQLMQTGCQDLGAAIQRLVSSVQYFTPVLMDGADHVYPLLMRGLNADQVLVLINGKRYHTTAMLFENSRINKGAAAVDFRTIPIHAVERVEIMKDGASAQYGSDAIAGIVNIILKTNQENSVAINYGINSELDGQQNGLSAIYGSKFSQGNYQFFLNYNDKDKTDRAGLDSREQYFANDPLYVAPPVKNQEYGQAKFTDFNIGTTAAISLDPQTQFYAVAMFGHRVGESPGYFRRPLDNRNIREIYPHGFLPFIAPVIKNTNATVGFETTIHEWDCDFSATYGSNIMEFHVKNSLNASLGVRSPQSFYCGSLYSSQQLVNINLKRKYLLTENIPLFLALGAEFGLDNYRVEKGDQNSYMDGGVPILDGPNAGGRAAPGAQVLPGFTPSNEIRRNRHNFATYADAETKFLDMFSLGGAVRAEKYSDFGETVNGKISLRADFLKYFALRGAIGSGFRAPSLSQAFYSSTVTNFIDGIPYENGLFNTEHPISRQLGAKPLKPEHSWNYNAGFIINTSVNFGINN